jgi:hypothetical protein
LPGCKALESTISSSVAPILELLDSGLLQIRHGQQTLCVLHSATEDKGRLAVLFSGFLRTYLKTCNSHVLKIFSQWSGSKGVDVHIFSYLEEVFQPEPVTKNSVEENLRKCYGTYLKTISIVAVRSVEDIWADATPSVKNACGQSRLNRVISQIKSVYMAGQQVTAYMIQHGIQYDYILRMRPDLLLWGDIPALYEVPHGQVIIPNPAKEWFYYCVTHNGLERTGTNDQIAYGRASAMWTYINMYTGLRSMLTMTKEPTAMIEGFATHQHNKFQPTDKERCSVECYVTYWMYLNGVSLEIDWRWQQNLIRSNGWVEYNCPDKNRTWNCPGKIPN